MDPRIIYWRIPEDSKEDSKAGFLAVSITKIPVDLRRRFKSIMEANLNKGSRTFQEKIPEISREESHFFHRRTLDENFI